MPWRGKLRWRAVLSDIQWRTLLPVTAVLSADFILPGNGIVYGDGILSGDTVLRRRSDMQRGVVLLLLADVQLSSVLSAVLDVLLHSVVPLLSFVPRLPELRGLQHVPWDAIVPGDIHLSEFLNLLRLLDLSGDSDMFRRCVLPEHAPIGSLLGCVLGDRWAKPG